MDDTDMSMNNTDMAKKDTNICMKETKVLANLFQKIVENCKVGTFKFYQSFFLWPGNYPELC